MTGFEAFGRIAESAIDGPRVLEVGPHVEAERRGGEAGLRIEVEAIRVITVAEMEETPSRREHPMGFVETVRQFEAGIQARQRTEE